MNRQPGERLTTPGYNIIPRFARASARLAVAWQLVAKRSLASWRMLSSIVIGTLLASSLMAGSVIYFDALRETALKNTLAQAPPTDLDIVLQTTRGPTTEAEYLRLHEAAVSEVNQRVAWMLKGWVRAGRSPTMFLAEPGREADAGQDNARAYFVFMDELEANVEVQQWGRMPTSQALHQPGEPPSVEAVVPREAADLFGVGVGDSLTAVPTWTDDAPFVRVVISGVFDRTAPAGEFWHLDSVMATATGEDFRAIPFYVTESAFLNVVGPPLLKMDSSYFYLLDVDEDRLNAGNAPIAASSISALGAFLDTTLNEYLQATRLDDLIRRYDRRLFFSRLPMFMVLALIGVVVLYYVATLSSLAVESRRGEIALLRSRGASSPQTLVVFALEGLTIAAITAAAAPPLAAGAVSLMGFTPAFSDLTGGAPLDVKLSPASFLMGALGGALGLVALVFPAVQASRVGVIRHRQEAARPTAQPMFQRYYVDVLLLVVSVYLFRQLTQQGSVVATSLLGEAAVSELLLALPGLTLVAAAVALLRIFPIAMSLAGRLVAAGAPAGLVMGLWQIARSPTHYARLSLLLILAAGLGIFASSFGATLERSFRERVLHSTGADVKVEGVQGRSITDLGARALSAEYAQAQGVTAATAVLRKRGQDLSKLGGIDYDMFGIDPAVFGRVAFFREDYADSQIGPLLARLEHTPPSGVEIPPGAKTLTARVKPDRAHPGVRVTAQVRDPNGAYRTLSLGRLGSSDWADLSADLPAGPVEPPMSLVSIRLHETDPFVRMQAGSLRLDEVRITTPAGVHVLESFDEVEWTPLLSTDEAISDAVRQAGDVMPGETGAALFTWSEGSSQTARGIFHGTGRTPIPALASRSFLRSAGRSVGDELEVLVAGHRAPVRLVGVVDLFPTVTAQADRYLVADLDALTGYANMAALANALAPNQVWAASSTTGPERERLLDDLQELGGPATLVFDRGKRLEETRVDPLVNAGWRSLLFLSFAAVLILSCVGFLVHAYVSYRSRLVQFALMRTVGVSVSQLITMVWIEQALVVALGMALGAWMGARLGAVIMPFLGNDDWGDRVVPPFAVEVDWTALLATYGLMFAVFALITLGLVWLIGRIAIHSALRLGDA